MAGTRFCTISVDHVPLTGPAGLPLIDFLARHDIDLPHICYQPTLGGLQTCDVCWVEVGGELQRGCTLKAEEGLTIRLKEPLATEARKEGIDRVLASHELYCSVCENNNGDCRVHNVVRDMEVPHQRYPFKPKPYPIDDSHPFYQYDPDQCILCGRCVEACQNVQVTETLSIDWEREHPRVLWDGGEVANESSCVSCGHCVTVCPCNALMEKSMLKQAGPLTGLPDKVKRPAIDLIKSIEPTTGFKPIFALSEMDAASREPETRRTKTVCTYCGVGCAFEIWTRDRTILKVQPVEEAPANGISTCIKGKFGWDFVNSEKRLTTPLIRRDGAFHEASWDEAYALIASRFKEIRQAHGPDALAFVASSKCSNEESYLMQKFARAVIGTNNIDNCSRYCQSPATTGLWRTQGYGGDDGSISDLEAAETVLIIGSNTAESHPVIAARLKRAAKLRGQKHIVVDPRRHEMAERAYRYVRPQPGTDLVWLSGIARHVLDNALEDRAFLASRVNGLEEYRQSLAPFDPEYVERKTGIDQRTLQEMAELISTTGSLCIVWAMGVTQHVAGSDTSTAIANLLLITGNAGRHGCGAYPMRGHNNVQGCSDFGSMPDRFPGYEMVSDDTVRARYEQAWGVTLSTNDGHTNHSMVEAIHDGTLRSLYIVGEEMAIVDTNANSVQAALDQLDFLVVQDIFLTRTGQHADVVLPASPSLEKEGTFVNTERRFQRLYQALPPLGNSKPDWLIHTELARAMGADWNYDSPADIMQEAAALAPLFAGVSYERLEGFRSLQWPVAADGTDTPYLYLERFAFDDGKARLYPLTFTEPANQPDNEYDLHVNNGRALETFHEGNLTNRTPGIVEQVPTKFVEISPQLAAERGVQTGSLVALTSPHGEVHASVLVTDRVVGKQLFLSESAMTTEHATNRLTSDAADKDSDTPAFKEIAARMRILKPAGEPPLPQTNFRFWEATPNTGPQAELKHQRRDYLTPPLSAPAPEKH